MTFPQSIIRFLLCLSVGMLPSVSGGGIYDVDGPADFLDFWNGGNDCTLRIGDDIALSGPAWTRASVGLVSGGGPLMVTLEEMTLGGLVCGDGSSAENIVLENRSGYAMISCAGDYVFSGSVALRGWNTCLEAAGSLTLAEGTELVLAPVRASETGALILADSLMVESSAKVLLSLDLSGWTSWRKGETIDLISLQQAPSFALSFNAPDGVAVHQEGGRVTMTFLVPEASAMLFFLPAVPLCLYRRRSDVKI